MKTALSFPVNLKPGLRRVFHLFTTPFFTFPATRFIAILLFTIVISHSYAQPCTDTAKKINYYSPGYRFSLQQHLVTETDAILLAGRCVNTVPSAIFYAQIQPDGTFATSKKLSSNEILAADNATTLIDLQNGNKLLSVGSFAGTGLGSSIFKLLLLYPNGNIIWSKKYTDANNGLMAVKAIKETADNEFIVMLNFIDEDPLHYLDFGTAFCRIDALGNVRWSHYVSVVSNYVLEGTAFAILNNRIYCVGVKRSENFFLGFPDYEHNL